MVDGSGDPSRDADRFAAERQRMVHDQLRARGIHDPATLAAMSLVPREAFVPAQRGNDAYADGALSIGGGQTISQPYIVARMTELLRLGDAGWPWQEGRPAVLDVGTGSGYQAAVLAQIGAVVTSVERDATLAETARERLRSLGYQVEVVVADGTLGHAAGAPYAGIVVAAAAPSVPPPLIDQLADGARVVIPLGTRASQRLTVVRRVGDRVETSLADPCVFVPLVGSLGFPS
jgi:protein-L-isoaspartate(D-aspartate) O-methyltransferase